MRSSEQLKLGGEIRDTRTKPFPHRCDNTIRNDPDGKNREWNRRHWRRTNNCKLATLPRTEGNNTTEDRNKDDNPNKNPSRRSKNLNRRYRHKKTNVNGTIDDRGCDSVCAHGCEFHLFPVSDHDVVYRGSLETILEIRAFDALRRLDRRPDYRHDHPDDPYHPHDRRRDVLCRKPAPDKQRPPPKTKSNQKRWDFSSFPRFKQLVAIIAQIIISRPEACCNIYLRSS